MTTKGKIILWSSVAAGLGGITWFFFFRKINAVTDQDRATLRTTNILPDNSITATQTTGSTDQAMYVQADLSSLAAQVGNGNNYGVNPLPGVTTYDPTTFLNNYGD